MNDQTKTSECKSCGSEIKWMKTFNDKNIPVDVPPIDDPDRDDILRATLFDRNSMKTHFETCPDADKHRSSEKPGAVNRVSPENTVSFAKKLNTAMATLEDIAKNAPDGMRSQTLASTALHQIRRMK